MCGKKEWKPKRKLVWAWPHFEQTEDEEDILCPASSDRALNSNGLSNMSVEQINRDKKITRLLEAYVKSYELKSSHSVWCRYIILGPCMLIVLGITCVLGWLCINMASAEDGPTLEELAAFVTACVSFLALIIGILHIITEYFFPKEDEKYITEIVKLVQTNDLENRKESARTRKTYADPSLPPSNELPGSQNHEEELSDLPGIEDNPPPYSDDEL